MQTLPSREQKEGAEQGQVTAASRAGFSNAARKPLCSELMSLKLQIQMDPKSSQIHVRLAKAKGSPKDCLMGGKFDHNIIFI